MPPPCAERGARRLVADGTTTIARGRSAIGSAPSARSGWTTHSKLVDSVPVVHAALVAIAAASFLGAPGGPPETQTAALGNVSATINWTVSEEGGLVRNFRVAITREGQRLVDEPVTVRRCAAIGCALGPATFPPARRAVAVVDLEGEGEPEVVVDTYTGGAHCCTVSKIWRFDGEAYSAIEHDWGNQVYRLRDFDRDGRVEFRSADDRFSYAFGSYAESRWPVQILRYRNGRMRDVTRRFPRLVRRDMRAHRRPYVRSRRTRHVSRPALAAYVADLHLLGRHQRARHIVRTALRSGELRRRHRYDIGPFGVAFVRRLNRLLRTGGYLR